MERTGVKIIVTLEIRLLLTCCSVISPACSFPHTSALFDHLLYLPHFTVPYSLPHYFIAAAPHY